MEMKYCNRCGAQLVTTKDNDTVKLFEKRMDSEMEGLFWIIVLGLALIIGGMASSVTTNAVIKHRKGNLYSRKGSSICNRWKGFFF